MTGCTAVHRPRPLPMRHRGSSRSCKPQQPGKHSISCSCKPQRPGKHSITTARLLRSHGLRQQPLKALRWLSSRQCGRSRAHVARPTCKAK